MDTAVRLNELIVEHSHDAQLVMVNLPGPPDKAGGNEEQNCIPDSHKKRGSGYCATSLVKHIYHPCLLHPYVHSTEWVWLYSSLCCLLEPSKLPRAGYSAYGMLLR